MAIFVILAVSSVFLYGIYEKLEASEEADAAPAGYVNVYINGTRSRLDLESDASLIEVTSLNCETDLTIRADATDDYEIYFDGIEISDGNEIEYRLEMLDQNYTVPVWVVNRKNGAVKDYKLATFPSAIPDYTITGESPYEGDYYLTIIGSVYNVAMKVGLDGQLKYYRYNPNGYLVDFKKVVTSTGDVRYLCFSTLSTHYDTNGSSVLGEYIVMDEQYREIKRLRMVESENIPIDGFPVDQHDCLYINDNEYYLMSFVDKNVYNIPEDIPQKENGSLVVAAVIQGFKNGEMFFEWDSTDFPELYAMSVESNDFTNSSSANSADYVHINSMYVDPKDGNLIASFRNINSVLKIAVPSGEIIWTLGGKGDDFGLTEDQKTSRQHYAHYTDLGSILVFDNGNDRKQTRIVEYWLDEENRVLTDFKEYQIDGYYSMATGSVQRLDTDHDVYMIGWGYRAAGVINGLYPQFSEIDFTSGKTLVEFRFKNTNLSTYRCVKIA